jgi:hypothetical protein
MAENARQINNDESSSEESFSELPCAFKGCFSIVTKHHSGWPCDKCLRWFCEGHQTDTGRECPHEELWYCSDCIGANFPCKTCNKDLRSRKILRK